MTLEAEQLHVGYTSRSTVMLAATQKYIPHNMTLEAEQLHVGYTSRSTVMLDCDAIDIDVIECIAQYLLCKYGLGGYCIIKSSEHENFSNYHLLFDRAVTWETVLKAVAEAALLAKSESIMRWLCQQIVKGVAVLRLTAKQGQVPEIVKILGEKKCNIKTYLELRSLAPY